MEPPLAVSQLPAQRIRHDALLDDVARVARHPEDLSAQATSPKIDSGRAQRRLVPQDPREHVVRRPPAEEERPEQQRGRQAPVHAADAVRAVDAAHAVQRARVQPLALARRVLDLQARLDVLDRRRDHRDRAAGQHAGQAVAHGGEVRHLLHELAARRGGGGGRRGPDEHVLREQAPVHRQAPHQHAVHEHPADQRRRRALVEPAHALVAQRLRYALQGAAEARAVGCLETHLDCIEGVSDCFGSPSGGELAFLFFSFSLLWRAGRRRLTR